MNKLEIFHVLVGPKQIQSVLKEISPGVSLEGMMLKLKLQYFGHLMRRVDSLEKTLMMGGIECMLPGTLRSVRCACSR